MTSWPSTRASRVLAALLRIGWSVKRQTGSHRVLQRENWPDFVFAFHEGEEIGPRMLARIAKRTVSRLRICDLVEIVERKRRKLLRAHSLTRV